MPLAEASLPFLSPECFPFPLFPFLHHPSPGHVISFLDNCNGYSVAFSAQLSPLQVFLAMTIRLSSFTTFFITKFPIQVLHQYPVMQYLEPRPLCLAFQILRNPAPASTARGESGPSVPAKLASSLFPVHARIIPTSISYSFPQCPPHPLCLIKFPPSFQPSCSPLHSLPYRTS